MIRPSHRVSEATACTSVRSPADWRSAIYLAAVVFVAFGSVLGCRYWTPEPRR